MDKEIQKHVRIDPITGELVSAENDFAAIADELVAAARGQGIELTGSNGPLTGLTRQVLQTALEAEMADHLGYDKHVPAGRNGLNSRNGSTPEDGANRGRGSDRSCAQGPGWNVLPSDGPEVFASPRRLRRCWIARLHEARRVVDLAVGDPLWSTAEVLLGGTTIASTRPTGARLRPTTAFDPGSTRALLRGAQLHPTGGGDAIRQDGSKTPIWSNRLFA